MEIIITLLEGLSPWQQALIATLFTWGITALGAAFVFFTKTVNRKLLDIMFGFAGGVMIAASYWSLLAPAIEMAQNKSIPSWVPATVGFLTGALFLSMTDKILPHLHIHAKRKHAEGLPTNWEKSVLLVLAITLHNIPEGLAIGVAFGGAALGLPSATLTGAIVLAIGIGLQNFPEGMAISLPLRKEGMSRWKSFQYGQASALVEPLAGVLGAVAIVWIEPLLPYALAFAAGAMIFVVVEEVIPESQEGGNTDLSTLGLIIGFTIMMILDVAFS